MTYGFSGIKTSHVYKNIKKHYYLIFKGMKKSQTIRKIFVQLGDSSVLPSACNFIYESDWFKYFFKIKSICKFKLRPLIQDLFCSIMCWYAQIFSYVF